VALPDHADAVSADGTIDAAALGAFIADCYREAGFAQAMSTAAR
jgi:hypothetical protein